jgi:nicotinamide-nucleotide amidase
MNYEEAIKNIRRELENYILGNNIKSLVMGVSGGMDSCLCAVLAKPVCDKLNIPLIGRSMPASSNQPDELERAKLTGKVFCTEFDEMKIEEEYNFMAVRLESNFPRITLDNKIRNGNLKARLRMIHLYDLASLRQGIVLSTDNYTELMLGFWTLHGDVGDYGMIQNLYKSEVYDMAEWIAENECKFLDESTALTSAIEALATDGLGVTNRGDLGQILPTWEGSSRAGYKEVDRILQVWENRFQLGERRQAIIEQYSGHPVVKRHVGTIFKRVNPVNIPRAVILYGPSIR